MARKVKKTSRKTSKISKRKREIKKGMSDNKKILLAVLVGLGAIALSSLAYILSGGSFITGAQAADSKVGQTAVNISEIASIILVSDIIDFGGGYVFSNASFAELDSGLHQNGNVVNGTWINITDGTNSEFIIENDGNVDLNVTLQSGKVNSSFIGGNGTYSRYQYRPSFADLGNGCEIIGVTTGGTTYPWNWTGNDVGLNATWTDFNSATQNACFNLTYRSTAKWFEVDLRLQIPKDAPPGIRNDTITFTGTALAGDETV